MESLRLAANSKQDQSKYSDKMQNIIIYKIYI